MTDIPHELSQFFGRFHLLLVHLPIGFLVLLACLEALSRWRRFHPLTIARGSVLALTVAATALSSLCGWLLALGGGYDARLLAWHMWTGVGVAGACLLALLVHWLKWRSAYDAMLAVALVGLLVASHFGGSLTHGNEYLIRYLPALERQLSGEIAAVQPVAPPAVPPAASVGESAFTAWVMPVMTAKCVACHGPDKVKAGLRLDSYDAILKEPKLGPVVVPGNSAASELVKRLEMPIDHENAMPPPGDPSQVSADEIALVRWWIDAGAPEHKTPAELNLPPHLQHGLAAGIPPTQPASKP